jgi:DNA-binding CsgD family transcriptional regulator/tetratricopeptide (TPR) repeat protein
MRDAIAWSYDLLGDDEQRLLRTLSVFSGGFTLDAVEAIAPDDEKPLVIDLLTRLIDHSLVQRTATPYGTARFTMLETIREFALDALKARDEEPSARNRHLRWMVEFVGSPTPDRFYELRGPADPSFYAELDNLRVAFNWAIDHHDAPRAAQLAWGLLRIWWHFGLTSEALESVQRLVDHPEGLDPVVNATVNEWLSAFACHHGDNERARAAATEALAKFRELDHTLGINISLATLGEATWWSDPGRAVELFSQAVEIGRGLEDRRVLAWDLHWRSYAFIALGDAQRALIDLNEAVALFEQFQVHDEVRFDQSLALNYLAWAWGLCGRIDLATDCVARGLEFSRQYNVSVGMFAANRVLGELARARGDLEQAFAHLRECLLTAHRDALESWRVCAIIQIAMVAQAAGDWQRAARLFGYAGSQWLRHNYAESSRSVSTWGYTVDLTRHALGDDAFAAGFEAGGLLTSAEAFIEASSITVPEIARSVHDSPLTRRETEVLAHLAQGKTNQEIATNLFVGKSTVDTHVAHILTKLGVESRREAINVARKRGLLNEQSAAEAAPDPSQRC